MSMQDTDIHDILVELLDSFKDVSFELAQVMFGSPIKNGITWSVSDCFDGDHEYVFSLYSYNDKYKATTIIGASLVALNALFGKEVTLEEAKDALGEYANIYCAMMMDCPLFVSKFGIMRQKPPEDAINISMFPQAWTVQGKIQIENETITIGYAVQKNRIKPEMLESLDTLKLTDIIGI